MRILIVDDDHTYGSLLGRAIKRLGHTPLVVTHPDDALEAFHECEIDAVIADIDMPGMSGLEMATRMRAEDPELPIAFCSGTSEKAVLALAETIGRLLPKVWTIADVRELVLQMGRARPTLAKGSVAGPPPRQLAAGAVAPRAARTSSPPRMSRSSSHPRPRKIKVSCHNWDQVARLCDQYAAGKNVLTLRGSHRLRPHEPLIIAISLPDELVLLIDAEVAAVSVGEDGAVFSIQLTGMTPETLAKMRSLVVSGQGVHRASVHRMARGSSPRHAGLVQPTRPMDFDLGDTEAETPIESTPVGVVLGNLRLRQQIDRLPQQLRRRETTESD